MKLNVFYKNIGNETTQTVTKLFQDAKFINYVTDHYTSVDPAINYGVISINNEEHKLVSVSITFGDYGNANDTIWLSTIMEKDVLVLNDIMAKLMTRQFTEDNLMLSFIVRAGKVKIELTQDTGRSYNHLVQAEIHRYNVCDQIENLKK